jgi:signal transduction histidine kinase
MQLHEHPFFTGTDCSEIKALLGRAKLKRFDPGEIVYDEGSESDCFCLVLEGRVRFEKRSCETDLKFRVVNESGPGEAFGEMGVILGTLRFLRVSAVEPLLLALVPGETMRAAWDAMSPIARRLGDVLMRHLCDTTGRYVEDAVRQERLATLGTMVSAISHDLRTPITLINLNAQLIETVGSTADPTLTAVISKHCRNIEAQVERMMGMLEEVSDFTHGRASDDYARIDLSELFETFRFLNSPYWESAGVVVEFRGQKALVDAAPRKLLRVLQNLVGNAVDAMEGRQDGRITLSCGMLDDKHAFISVADNGPGIPEKIRETFWEPFVTSGKARGTGLGTAICRALVEAHGGRVDFDTEADRGTTFNITLPVRRPKRGVVTGGAPALLRSSGR